MAVYVTINALTYQVPREVVAQGPQAVGQWQPPEEAPEPEEGEE